jgi:hypothetical protein
MAFETPPAKPAGMTTAVLLAALRASYGPEPDISHRRGGAGVADLLVEEVEAPGTNRRCDLLRIGMWPSRGHRIIVHELKVSRSDWQRELDDPAKAEAWWPHCHEFWIVAPAGLIDPGEVPEGWGLMVPPVNGRSRKFRVLKKAASREPTMTASLVAAILRRADNMRLAQISQLNADRERMISDGIDKARREIAAQKLSDSLRGRLELLERLETALGTRLDRFTWGSRDGGFEAVSPEELAAALREYTADHVAIQERTVDLRRTLKHAAQYAALIVKAFEEIPALEVDDA